MSVANFPCAREEDPHNQPSRRYLCEKDRWASYHSLIHYNVWLSPVGFDCTFVGWEQGDWSRSTTSSCRHSSQPSKCLRPFATNSMIRLSLRCFLRPFHLISRVNRYCDAILLSPDDTRHPSKLMVSWTITNSYREMNRIDSTQSTTLELEQFYLFL